MASTRSSPPLPTALIQTTRHFLTSYLPASRRLFCRQLCFAQLPTTVRSGLSCPPQTVQSKKIVFGNADFAGLQAHLASFDWSCLNDRDINSAVEEWTSIFLSECLKFVPIRITRVDPTSKPWFSPHLRHLASYRDRLFKRSRGKPTASRVMVAYCRIRNLFVSEMRAAERHFFSGLSQQLANGDLNAHHWWKLAKRACGWSFNQRVASLSVNNVLITEPSEKASVLNLHFQQQCSSPPPPSEPDRYSRLSATTPSFVLEPISADADSAALSKLCCRKSAGPDGMPNELLRMAATQIGPPLAVLFNRSVAEGVFPSAWKEAFVSPILRMGKDPSVSSSYRPIALLSNVSKVFERLVYNQLVRHCLENDLVPDEQFGFLKG